jgi:AcrR family transcriptional regulator
MKLGDKMPPKTIFDREMVLSAAFELLTSDGINGITARSVAMKLNSTVGPIYREFGSIDGLKIEVMKKASVLLEEYMCRSYTENQLLNIGVGMVRFARDEPVLYHALFTIKKDYPEYGAKFRDRFRDKTSSGKLIKLLPEDERKKVLDTMIVFVNGLGFLASKGLLEDDSDDFIIQFLQETSVDIVSAKLLNLEK